MRFLGWEDPLDKGQAAHSRILGSLVAQLVKSPPAVWESWVSHRKDPLEKGCPLQYSGRENSMESVGSQRVGHG